MPRSPEPPRPAIAALARRRLLRWAAGGAALVATAPALHAAAAPRWPNRPVRLIVVYPPGGVSDATARALAQPLARALGVPVLVDNRAGAGGSVGIDLLARAAPDGHTLAFSAITPLTLQPLLVSGGLRDPLGLVAPVVGIMHTPVLVMGTPALGPRSFTEMVALAHTRPGAVRWASSGVATTGHMVLVQTRLHSGADITHVPYQGGGAQLNDALGGQFEVLSSNLAAQQLEYVGAGRLHALAVGSPARMPALREVPTLAELGYPRANLSSLFGLFAPAHTPAAVVQGLNDAVNRILNAGGFAAMLRDKHLLPAGGTVAAFAQQITADRQGNEALVRQSGAVLR
ncbi:tripartite tricarboxylate transporter substrate binding protein [Acidovorax sp.]|uniref:Bug family tripartite tricarboxylate transporter substrate binding protein n=1 Tax=Acidovorax sp. TaxID=1872122 RepID=UPI002ACE5FFD|nr:tripartite tricarboxylate transporter substrate binding protein [Acidovorax sp.]MDZ7865744.1 tripartite tricarboxylate transporter substrate binding protein [Acidovorax sp.]